MSLTSLGAAAEICFGTQATLTVDVITWQVNVFRKWFHEMAGNGIPYAEGVPRDLPPLETDRTKLLDRWEQHTRDCPACRAAHDRLGAAQVRRRRQTEQRILPPPSFLFLAFPPRDAIAGRDRAGEGLEMSLA